MPRPLSQRQLVVVTGKGGVGKTVMTAVLARWMARRGRRALALEVDPRESLHRHLDVAPSGGAVIGVEERLGLQNLDPQEALDRLVERQVMIGPIVRRLRRSPVYRRFTESAPGLREVAILHHALELVEEGPAGARRLDAVVLDAPASGHGLSLLTAARLLTEALGEGPLARIAERVAAWVADPARCAVVVVTQAEEMPVQEAIELDASLEERLGRRADLLIVNGLYPPCPAGEGDDPSIGLWRRRRALNDRELERLEASWAGPSIRLPLLPVAGGGLVEEMLPRFEGLRGEPWI